MKSIRDWVFTRLLSSSRSLSGSGSFFSEGPADEDSNAPGTGLLFSPSYPFIVFVLEGCYFVASNLVLIREVFSLAYASLNFGTQGRCSSLGDMDSVFAIYFSRW